MKVYLAHCLCATIFAVSAASFPAVAQTDEFPGHVRHLHRPMTPYRNPDGTFVRLKGAIENANWSGYAATAGAPYTTTSATWQVPEVA
jgi:hypothetical protein